jgi:hypothetical protein
MRTAWVWPIQARCDGFDVSIDLLRWLIGFFMR